MSLLIITGTGTGVGKTIATAALAAAARALEIDVAVCKPVQTGTAPAAGGGDDDLAEVARLAGVTALHGVARFPEPLAPAAAAALAGRPLPTGAEVIASVAAADGPGRLTLAEGAGGLLVSIGAAGFTLRDLALEFSAPVLVVCGAGLGTLNHTALTLEALENKGISCAGLVIGSWPTDPGPAELSNREELPRLAAVRAALPARAATLDAARFGAMSAAAFDADWVAGLA